MRGVSHELTRIHPAHARKSCGKNLARYTDNCGSQVRSGRRQSMPFNSIDNCARVSETVPLLACGHTKRPRSRRFANKRVTDMRRGFTGLSAQVQTKLEDAGARCIGGASSAGPGCECESGVWLAPPLLGGTTWEAEAGDPVAASAGERGCGSRATPIPSWCGCCWSACGHDRIASEDADLDCGWSRVPSRDTCSCFADGAAIIGVHLERRWTLPSK
jgi:hypothetical protein